MALAVLSRRVAEMVEDGADLAEVEIAIEATKLDDEEKSALWLLAWSCGADDERVSASSSLPWS